MPTFCRHNRFLERCPICSKTLPGHAPGGRQTAAGRGASKAAGAGTRSRSRREGVQVRKELRAHDDGYRSELAPGLRASADAARLAREIAFASGRLAALAAEPPGLYGEVRTLAAEDPERATWACFLIAYLCPLEGEDPFAGIRLALAAGPEHGAPSGEEGRRVLRALDLQSIPLGPRTSHDPARGAEVLLSYLQWVQRGGTPAAQSSTAADVAGATQAQAFIGDPGWSPQRRFERVFERLALPGFGRMGRYDLLVTLGRLGVYELSPDSLHLGGARGQSAEDPTQQAAKRVFAIADALLLERRASALAEAAGVPVEALDLALGNWASAQRATLGFPAETEDAGALASAESALEI
jgi:Alpha-glutamyl/putrescinyl thymine pyrophosphorylase clade 3